MSGLIDEIEDVPEDQHESAARDKLITARVRLQKEQPFFSYLTMGLNLIETKTMPTAGVDNNGNLYYNPDFVNGLNKEQTKTLLAHEALHVALIHLSRIGGDRRPFTWNVACDIIVNNMLKMNKFEFTGLMSKAIVPDDNKYKIGGVVIKDLDKKFVEEVYDIIEQLIKHKKIMVMESAKGDSYKDSDGVKQQLDKHKHGKPKEQESKQEKEAREKTEKEWKKRLSEAYTYSKNQGKEPLGAERHIDELLHPKLNWREILYRFVTNEIPFDFTYSYPSKKSIATGYYMPSIIRDNKIEVTVAIDTSGSIGEKELNEFVSEVYGIGKSFTQVKMHLLYWDAALQNHYQLDNTELDDLLKYKINGGGGTDFSRVYDYMKKEIPLTKVLVFLTDGFATFPSKEQYKTLWVLSKESAAPSTIPFGEVIKIQ